MTKPQFLSSKSLANIEHGIKEGKWAFARNQEFKYYEVGCIVFFYLAGKKEVRAMGKLLSKPVKNSGISRGWPDANDKDTNGDWHMEIDIEIMRIGVVGNISKYLPNDKSHGHYFGSMGSGGNPCYMPPADVSMVAAEMQLQMQSGVSKQQSIIASKQSEVSNILSMLNTPV